MTSLHSYGVIICRLNTQTRRVEAIVVRRRATYSFVQFVRGAHTPRNLSQLLGAMTLEELLDIWSLNSGQMWYRLWLQVPNASDQKSTALPIGYRHSSLEKLRPSGSNMFARGKKRFEATFLARRREMTSLRLRLREAPGEASLPWHPPRGRPRPGEDPLACAVRETAEETGVAKKNYRLLLDLSRTDSFTEGGTHYVHKYYVALAQPWFAAQNALPRGGARGALDCGGEMSGARWVDIEAARGLFPPLAALLAPIFRAVKKICTGRRHPRSFKFL